MKKNIINVAVTLFFLLTLGAETGQAQTSSNQFKSYYGAVVGATSGGLSKGGGTKSTQIEGTWLLTVTTPPAAGRPPFEVLISFASGGGFLAPPQGQPGGHPQQGASGKADPQDD